MQVVVFIFFTILFDLIYLGIFQNYLKELYVRLWNYNSKL